MARRGRPKKKVVTKPKVVVPKKDEISTQYAKRMDINHAPISPKLRGRVREFIESSTWRGTDDDARALLKFYQVTFRDSPERWMDCGKCFERGCKRIYEYLQENDKRRVDD